MGEEDQRHRLVVLGAGNVGKTSIVQRFLNKTFTRTYKQTVEDLHCRDYDIYGTVIKVDILDTAGNLVFPAMRRLSISTAHAFLLVYSIDNMESFLEVKSLWDQIKEQKSGYQDIPLVVVGSKCDIEQDRQVTEEEVQSWVMSEGISTLVEVSSKEDRGIVEVFQKLLDMANIPEIKKMEPVLRRGLSAKAGHFAPRDRLKVQEDTTKLSRSRSLIRRSNKPKVKNTGDPNRNDCILS